MKTLQWEIEGLAEERIRREARKKNDAFRRQLEIRKAEKLASARLKLRAATCAAGVAWTYVAIRLFH